MNIAVYHPEFTSSHGGGKKVHFKIVEVLEKAGHSVDFYNELECSLEDINKNYSTDIKNSEQHTVNKPKTIELFNKLGKFYWVKRYAMDRFFYNQIKTISPDYDLVFVTSELQDQPRKEIETPVINYVHKNPLEEKISEETGNKIYETIVRNIASPYVMEADLTLFNSEFTKDNTKIENPCKIIYPPVDTNIESRDWSEKENQAIYVSRLAKDKRQKETIEIIRETDLDLILAGYIDDEDYYKDLKEAEKNLEWLTIKENIEQEKLVEEISKSKIGLMCSRREDFGIPAVEYMYGNCIPMVYNSYGVPQIVGDEDLTYETVEEAQNKIQKIITEPEDKIKYIQQRKQNFSEEKFKSRIKSTIELIIDE